MIRGDNLNHRKFGVCLTVAVVAVGAVLALGIFSQTPNRTPQKNSNSLRYETPPSEWHSPPNVSIGQGFGVGEADYIVFKGSEGNVYAKSGENGQIMYESSEADDILNKVSGTNITVALKGMLTLHRTWDLENGMTVKAEGGNSGVRKMEQVSTTLTSDASAGQKDVEVDDATGFKAGQGVCIYDDYDNEMNTIASISGNTLTMETSLSNTYEVDNNAAVETAFPAIRAENKSDVKVVGVEVDGNKANISQNEVGDHKQHGIAFKNVSDGEILYNHVYNNVLHGIQVFDSDNIKVVGNTSENNGRVDGAGYSVQAGILVFSGSKNILVAMNNCFNNNGNNIYLSYKLKNIRVIANHTKGGRLGINFTNYCDYVVIDSNIVENHSNKGISPCAKPGKEADFVQITNNIIRHISGSGYAKGIDAQNVNNLLISGNTIDNTESDGIEVDNVTNLTVGSNVLKEIGSTPFETTNVANASVFGIGGSGEVAKLPGGIRLMFGDDDHLRIYSSGGEGYIASDKTTLLDFGNYSIFAEGNLYMQGNPILGSTNKGGRLTIDNFVNLAPRSSAPSTPDNGDIVYADGSTWNPGSGSGIYVYDNGAWQYLGGAGVT